MIKFKFLGLLLAVFLVGCKEQSLLSSLDQKQANEVIAILQSHNINAVKQSSVKEGFSILVDKDDFLNAVNLVNYYGLPAKPRVEISNIFPNDSLVASPLAEKARLYSAIEQRLEQSLTTINGVITASLHLSYDFNADYQKKKSQDIHLTAIVRYQTGLDDQMLIADIKRFLKNSFSEVDYENISVVMTAANKYESLALDIPENSGSSFIISILTISFLALFICVIFIMKMSRASLKRKIDKVSTKVTKNDEKKATLS